MFVYRFLLIVAFVSLNILPMYAQEQLSYQMPPKAIADMIDGPSTPGVSLSPDQEWMLLLGRPNLPSIAELAQPEKRIGGLRINPRTNGNSRRSGSNLLTLKSVESGEEIPVANLPANPNIQSVQWSPNGAFIAFTHSADTHIELWIVEVEKKTAKKLTEDQINAAMAWTPFEWLSDSKTIIYKAIPEGRGEAPTPNLVPKGPVISENDGKVAAVRTYQDLLKNSYDESLFTYYTRAQLKKITVEGGASEKLGKTGIIMDFSSSPDGKYLLVEQIQQPFSYLVPYYRFPQSIDIWDQNGNTLVNLADVPNGEDIPKGFMSVRKGPRSHAWRTDHPSTLYWVEALDEGNPKNKVEHRDQLFTLVAPFTGTAVPGIKFTLRYSGISWGNADMAIASEYWWNSRRRITSMFQPDQPQAEKQVLFDLSTEDRYNSPGSFISTDNEWGRSVLLTDAKRKHLYLRGIGASPEGNRPFIDQFEISSKETQRLWRSEAPYYEYPLDVLDLKKQHILTRRESTKEVPNYFIRDLKKDKIQQITSFPDPYPQLKDVKKEMIRYTREDGVELSGTLYTPAGYNPQKDGPIPVLLWAYPEEFKSAAAAGQVSGSPHRFIRLYGGSPLFWLTQGYAVLDDPGMPVVGEGDAEPNDKFVEQLVGNAKAAIEKLVDMGVGDRDKMVIGGHSYGAFMTANLLAHSDLFSCGIARSGAYNRTLTPFGFQAEERTFWEAPEIYFTMSPFMHADKIKEPILLIHGEADNNSGTYPMQSKRFYNALKGHGANARLVMLPHESHGYRARESVMHMLWEMTVFMEKHAGKGFGNTSR